MRKRDPYSDYSGRGGDDGGVSRLSVCIGIFAAIFLGPWLFEFVSKTTNPLTERFYGTGDMAGLVTLLVMGGCYVISGMVVQAISFRVLVAIMTGLGFLAARYSPGVAW